MELRIRRAMECEKDVNLGTNIHVSMTTTITGEMPCLPWKQIDSTKKVARGTAVKKKLEGSNAMQWSKE